MLQQNCAGGIVFHKNMVLLIQNEKHEWVLPKGLIRPLQTPEETALNRILQDTGVRAKILGMAGTTSYEFYSLSRSCPVRNHVIWFAMTAEHCEALPDENSGFIEAVFIPVDLAVQQITYSQDKSILMMAWTRHNEL
jgi:ADP-ribose pyrophosphatase YjhB (NUDIX family)